MSQEKLSITTPVSTQTISQIKADLIIVPVFADKNIGVDLPPAMKRELSAKMRQIDFKGAWGVGDTVVAPQRLSAQFIAVVGLGKPDASVERQAEGLRRALARVLDDARRHALRNVVLMLPNNSATAGNFSRAAIDAAYFISYRFTHHKKNLQEEQVARSLRKLTLVCDRQLVTEVRQSVHQARITMEGATLARELVDQPASHASPKALVEKARGLADVHESISLTVLDKRQAQQKGFHAFLAVARGSIQEPYVIHLVYRGKNPKKKIALIGKGITFDSGGLSLKPSQSMTDMKIDMAGAATVLGVFAALPQLELDVEVHGIIAACENMPSGNAYRPGDVITSMNGKTIEILNTDAEGRVTLADALPYAAEQKVDAMIDIATLTGAVVIAAGEAHAGLWGNNQSLKDDILRAARSVGEGVVPFPLPDEYRQMIQSSVADVANSASNHPMAGATTAALFLREFVENGTPWAHLDVAGPVYFSRRILPYWDKGASGYGVRMLLSYLEQQSQQ